MIEEHELHDVDTLSKSSVSTFLRCGQQWFYAYVMKVKRPPSLRQAIGIAGHSAVEANFSQKIITKADVPADVVEDVFADEFDDMAPDVEPEEDEDMKTGKDSGIKAVRKHHEEVAPHVQPIMVEQAVNFEINGVPYSGWVDLVDDRKRVRDTKFVGKTPSKVTRDHQLSMIGYAVGYRQLTGEVESEVMLDNVVRLKREPKYVPIASGGPVTDAAIASFARTVTGVSEAIQKGVFVPNGLENNACSWCGYKDICPAYKEFR